MSGPHRNLLPLVHRLSPPNALPRPRYPAQSFLAARFHKPLFCAQRLSTDASAPTSSSAPAPTPPPPGNGGEQKDEEEEDKQGGGPSIGTWLAAVGLLTGLIVYGRRKAESQKPSKDEFKRYILVGKEPVSSTSSVFTLRPDWLAPAGLRDEDGTRHGGQIWRHGVLWSVQLKHPDLQIGRHYTPLPPSVRDADDEASSPRSWACTEKGRFIEGEIFKSERGPISSWTFSSRTGESPPPSQPPSPPPEQDPAAEDIRLLIRAKAKGEVSPYLHSLPLGAAVELRGPKIECALPAGVRNVVFLAGGTGIAPAMQAAYSLLRAWEGRDAAASDGRRGKRVSLFSGEEQSEPSWQLQLQRELGREHLKGERLREWADNVKVHILWANRRREDCVGGGMSGGNTSGSNERPTGGSASTPQGTGLGPAPWMRRLPGMWASTTTDDDGSPRADERPDERGRGPRRGGDGAAETNRIVSELEALRAAYPSQLTVEYFVDDEDTFIERESVARHLSSAPESTGTTALATTDYDSKAPTMTYVDFEPNDEQFKPVTYVNGEPSRNVVFVSGSDGFVAACAGPKVWAHGREGQGAVTGLLGTLDLSGWAVRKL